MHRLWIPLLFIVLLVGCQPAPPAAQSIPTLIPTPTVPIDMESAQRVAMLYFDAWIHSDFPAMHALTTFASQEATPLEQFIALYESNYKTMTFESLEIKPNTMQRQADRRIVLFNYDVTFHTRIPGSFTDTNRNLQLIIDTQVNDWRVAWSISDILPEFSSGAQLVFDKRIPSRANIYDRNGVILADMNGIAVRVMIIPDNILNRESCVPSLAEAVRKPVEEVNRLLDAARSNWEIDMGWIEPTEYNKWKDTLFNLCGATFVRQAARQYRRGSLMPHILGNVGYPDATEIPALVEEGFTQETIIGKSGVERTWDSVLRGSPGGRLQLVSPNGEIIRVLAETPSEVPESIWLTIDSDLQEAVTQFIGEAYGNASESWAKTSKGASAIVFDVNTGEIRAMVSWPHFDGNAMNPFPAIGREVAQTIIAGLAEDPRRPQLNRATQGLYPSGSTMKVVTSMAVLDSGLYDETTKFVCTGIWQQGNDIRYDWWRPGHGTMTTSTAITNSCNPFFYEAGFQLNAADPFLLPTYARAMGLGKPTGLTDLVESSGLVADPDWLRENTGLTWTSSNAVSMAIGQGELQVTPLQMVRMYAAIANGGKLYEPQLVRETGLINPTLFVAEPVVMDQYEFDPHAMEIIREGLCNVITGSTGTAAHIFRGSDLLTNIGVCGKTGTAQDPSVGVDHSWFLSYAPKEEPEIAVVVMIENAGDGSAIAAPITRRILEYYYFGR